MLNIDRRIFLKLTSCGLGATALFFLNSCFEKELAPVEDYDVVDTDSNSDFSSGLTQVLDVPGEDFKLVTEYSCDSTSKRAWRVTSDKFLYFNVRTEGLPDDTKVYIDNVHVDTTVKSEYAVVDGILQDTMDDRIHNAQMLGFPIGNDTYYYGVDAIEGSNDTFVQSTTYAYTGYYSRTESVIKRYTESDYLDLGVYANKFQFVYDLLIQGPNDETPRCVSVNTDFIVNITSALEDEKEKQKTK